MATLTLLLVLAGFFFFYHTSERMEILCPLPVEYWISDHRQRAKWIGSILWIGAILLSVTIWGVGAGVLFFSIMLMTCASLVVVLRPLKVINYKMIVVILFCSFLLETIL